MKAVWCKHLAGVDFTIYPKKPDFPVAHYHQVHGTSVLASQNEIDPLPQADGLFCTRDQLATLPMAIKTADCLPIALWNEQNFALIHAGWRGLADGILGNTELLKLNPTQAFIGPCIQQCCFEVSEDFSQHFPLSKLITRQERFYFDLVTEAQRQLQQLYPQIAILDSKVCTCCPNSGLASWRRDKNPERNWNILTLAL